MAVWQNRIVSARCERLGWHRSRRPRGTHIVRMVRRNATAMLWRTPAVAVNLVVVCIVFVEHWVMVEPRKRIVRRHGPIECRRSHRTPEPQVLCGTVDTATRAVVEPYTCQIDRHVYFLTGIGIVAEKPYFVVLAVHWLHPHLIDNHVCS